jgi:hypothetical protein
VPRKRRQDSPGTGGEPKPREYHQHGLRTIQSALGRVAEGEDWIATLGPVGVALRAWRHDLIEALGGDDVISPQRRALVELATRTHLMVESVDRYVLALPSLVNKSRRQLFAVVHQRQVLADSLMRQLVHLGLDRLVRDAPGIEELSRQLVAEREQESRPEDSVHTVPVAEDGDAGAPAEGDAPEDAP